MEKRNVSIDLNKAKEWFNKGGELKEIALQAYTKEELENNLCTSWEEYANRFPCTASIVKNIVLNPKYKALIKLILLRDHYNEGWEPDWTSDTTKYGVYLRYSVVFKKIIIDTDYTSHCKRVLTLKTRELADKYISHFGDIIRAAEDLI